MNHRPDLELKCYVLQNSPLRLVRVSQISSNSKNTSPSHLSVQDVKSERTISLDLILRTIPELTLEILHGTPDDQLLFFWAESTRFLVSNLQRTRLFFDNNESHIRCYRRITNLEGCPVGETAACDETSVDEEDERGVCEFLFIADIKPPKKSHLKFVLQIKRRGGIAYRVNTAEIPANAWNKSKLTRILIAFG